jgi:antigen flippase
MTASPPAATLTDTGQRTHGQILKSSVLIGSSQALNIFFGILRTKVMALLLGPTGVGLLGLYSSISDLVRSVAGLGINTSGVRQIAEAVGSGDAQRLARTVTTLRRVAVASGALGALLLVLFCRPVARLTFGDEQHAGWVALMALVVFFMDVSQGQTALVQGMRRIADLARISVLGALYGTVFSIAIVYYFYRQGAPERGVVPALICVAAMSILTSWWYARKVRVERTVLAAGDVVREARALLKLGVVFMSTTLLAMGVAYLTRLIVARRIGVEAAGHYQAAWVLGGLYVGFIIQAMGADFYPRLTAVARDHAACNRLVNEQAEVGLLLAGCGVVATLTFAPLVIELFYSAKFGPAVEILRWICLGMMLRVASWPMGFILVAKGEGGLFFWTELVSNAIQVALVWAGVALFQLPGTGIAFFGMYVIYTVGIYVVVRRLTGFRWSAANRNLALRFAPLVGVVFVSWYWLPPVAATVLGAGITGLVGIYSARTLCALLPWERLPGPARVLLRWLRLAPANPR